MGSTHLFSQNHWPCQTWGGVNADPIGVAVWLGEWVVGTDHGWLCQSPEPGQVGSCGVLAWLVGWLTIVLHASAAAVSVMICKPAMLSDIYVTIVGTLVDSTGGMSLVTQVPVDSGNLNTGTAGTYTGWSTVVCFSLVAPVVTLGDILVTQGSADMVSNSLPIPVTEC